MALSSVASEAQIDTTLKQYLPLHIGDCWQYVHIGEPPTYYEYFLSTVIGDTVMPNGKKYFIKTRGFFPSSGYYVDYVRIDDSLNVLVYTTFPECTASEYIMFRLAAEDSSLWPVCVQAAPGGAHHVSLLATFEWYYQNLDLWATTKAFSGSKIYTVSGDTTYQPLGATTYRLAKGIGIAGIVVEANGPYDLGGAIIDGNSYGQIMDVGNSEEEEIISRDQDVIDVFPNPFNLSTHVRYVVTTPGYVTLDLYDMLGRRMKSLVKVYREAGEYQVDLDGSGLSSGNYIVVLQTLAVRDQQIVTLSK